MSNRQHYVRDYVSRRKFIGTIGAGTLTSVAAAGVVGNALADDTGNRQEWKAKSDRKIRIGVVGGGFGLHFYWNKHPNCIVEAVSDLQPKRRQALMKTYACVKSYESLEKLILDPKIEAVAVFTDAPSHARHCIDVMNHGKHAISAVPAAMTMEDCQKLKEAKERTGLKYMMAETSYYRSPTIAQRNLYKLKAGGRLVYSEGQYYHHGVTRIASWKKWRYALPPMLYPTHCTAFYVGVSGGRLTKVSCLGFKGDGEEWRKNRYDNNPFINESALFRTSEDTMFRCNVFWWGHAEGETGWWVWEKEPKLTVLNTVPLPPSIAGGGHGGSQGPLANEFIMALVEEREPVIDIYESLAMTAPGIVAHQSALRGGEQLSVPSFDLTRKDGL